MLEHIIYLVLGLVMGIGIILGYLLTKRSKLLEAKRILEDALRQAEKIRYEAQLQGKEIILSLQETFHKEQRAKQDELKNLEQKLLKREEIVEERIRVLTRQQEELSKKEKEFKELEIVIRNKESEINRILKEQSQLLEKIAGLSRDSARELFLERLKNELSLEVNELLLKVREKALNDAEKEAKRIIVNAIQRFASSHSQETTVANVEVPNEELKGRIVGKQGRNIEAFQKVTGVELIVDDTPGIVVISCFDPIRREVARRTLEKLIEDGRIQPARIEEFFEITKKELEKEIFEVGKNTCLEMGFPDIHPKLCTLIGRLKYRTSYGQNVLQHIIEVGYLCGAMAGELRLDTNLARRCGFLHDMGKSVDHQIEGGHPEIGAQILKRYGEKDEVIEAALLHHETHKAKFPYTVLASAADAISASRPGARRDTFDKYIKRLERIESIALGFEGVEQSYAIQAGRELRVFINPDKIQDDSKLLLIARNIANQIEKELRYPGEIKVTVIKEKRVVEYAR
ncbi:MAG: ribonuclease Y [Planctomycetota bacterium]